MLLYNRLPLTWHAQSVVLAQLSRLKEPAPSWGANARFKEPAPSWGSGLRLGEHRSLGFTTVSLKILAIAVGV